MSCCSTALENENSPFLQLILLAHFLHYICHLAECLQNRNPAGGDYGRNLISRQKKKLTYLPAGTNHTCLSPYTYPIFSYNMRQNMVSHPFKASLIFAASYIILCSVYIWLSGAIAVKMSDSLPGLQNIELYKGLAFVTITGILIFTFSLFTLRRINTQQNELNLQRKLLLQSQAHILAGTFASGIAHDINNVLSSIDFGLAEIEECIPDSKKEHFNRVSRSYTMIKDMSERLLKMGKDQTQFTTKPVDMNTFINETIDFAKRHKKLKSCTIKHPGNEPISLKINQFLFEQMLINLMLNAADAAGQEGIIELHVSKVNNTVSVEIHDNGPGFSEENRKLIFKPFHSTKPDGTGLGLSTVTICAELHKGTITVDKSPLGGALFRISFPA